MERKKPLITQELVPPRNCHPHKWTNSGLILVTLELDNGKKKAPDYSGACALRET